MVLLDDVSLFSMPGIRADVVFIEENENLEREAKNAKYPSFLFFCPPAWDLQNTVHADRQCYLYVQAAR